MDFSEIWTNMWSTLTCTQGVSCFERYRGPVDDLVPQKKVIKNKAPAAHAEADWSTDEEVASSSSSLVSGPLEQHRRKLGKKVKLLKEGTPSELYVNIRIADDGRTLTWSTEKSPRTYTGILGGIAVDDVSEVQIDPKNDRIVLISAFEDSYEDDDTDDNARTFTTKFKFRNSEVSTQWIADFDKFLNEFSPPEEKHVLDFQDSTGRMSSILDVDRK